MTKKRIIKHGEAVFLEVAKPAHFNQLDQIRLNNNNSVANKLIVANSETSGNHHVLDVQNSELREGPNKIYVNNFTDIELSCVHEGRHDACVLPIPQKDHVWVRHIAQEWDHLEQEKRNVAD